MSCGATGEGLLLASFTTHFTQMLHQQNAPSYSLSPTAPQTCTHRKALPRPCTPLQNRSPISLEIVNLEGKEGIKVGGEEGPIVRAQAPGEVQTWPPKLPPP